ncbi:deoxyribonuclease, partial [Pseudomonas sp. KHB2.9]
MSPRPFRTPSERTELLLMLGSGFTVALIVIIVAVLLIREHASTLQAAKRSTTNITQLINADVLRNVELYDLALQGLIAATQRTDLSKVSGDIRHLVQFELSTAALFKDQVLLLDANGAVVADSSTLKPTSRNLADRDYFLVHKITNQSDLFISRPFMIQCHCEQV